jgi:hypothetical protein
LDEVSFSEETAVPTEAGNVTESESRQNETPVTANASSMSVAGDQAAGSSVTCFTGGMNSKPSDKDTPWSDEKEDQGRKNERV